jgi:hypothetical protein
MAMGCLAALFGIGVRPSGSVRPAAAEEFDISGMSEGDIHSGPGGYEGMGYSGGYAAEYRARHDVSREEPEDSWADLDEGEEA